MARLAYRLRSFLLSARTEGLSTAFQRALAYLLRERGLKPGRHRPALADRKLTDAMAFPVRALTGQPIDSPGMVLHWILPDFQQGAGGHLTIFRAIYWLEYFGHQCVVWISNPSVHATPQAARDHCFSDFKPLRAEFRFLDDGFDAAEGDVVIATECWTAFPALSAPKFAARAYFVQDFEPLFWPAGAVSALAASTYEHDFTFLAAGPWVASKLAEYGKTATVFQLALDNDETLPEDVQTPVPAAGERLRIAFYARDSTPRRAVELGWLAFAELLRRGIDFEVHAFGQDLDVGAFPFPVVSHGVLGAEALRGLYRRCDLGLCFSVTNYSLVPQEMAAEGLAVIDLRGPNTISVYPEDTVTLAGAHPASIATALIDLANDEALRQRRVENARQWARTLKWSEEFRKVEVALRRSVGKHKAGAGHVPVSVVVPTLNGGARFRELVEALGQQDYPGPVELVVVDSGSTDGTVEAAMSVPGVVLIRIDRSEFGHGRTRNLGISRAGGHYVALLTQDAVPHRRTWLFDHVQGLEANPRAAGAFGPQLAHRGSSAFIERDLREHFARIGRAPSYLDREATRRPPGMAEPDWMQALDFFSSNNAMLRRAAWEQAPFPDVSFGEDQLWARAILSEGWGKLYNPHASVRHSHDYDPGDCFDRARTEGAYYRLQLGRTLMTRGELDWRLRESDARDREFAQRHGIPEDVLARRLAQNGARLRGLAASLLDTEVVYPPPKDTSG